MFEIGFWRCITCLYNDTYDHAVLYENCFLNVIIEKACILCIL